MEEKRSQICLGTVAYDIEDREEVKNIVKPNFERYTRKHGYDFYFVREGLSTNFANNAFEETGCKTLYKISLIESLLEKGYEYVAILDCFDVLITNMEFPLENFIDEKNDIFFSAGVEGWGRRFNSEDLKELAIINTGFAIYKNSKFTKKFLEDVKSVEIDWNDPKSKGVNDQVLFRKTLKENKKYWENIAFRDPLQQSYWFYNTPQFWRNHQELYRQHKSPYIWEEGDFMIHFAAQHDTNYLLKEFHDYLYE